MGEEQSKLKIKEYFDSCINCFKKRYVEEFDFDFVIAGGGQAGRSVHSVLSNKGYKILMADWMKPPSTNVQWSFGGSTINASIYHSHMTRYAYLIGEYAKYWEVYNWEVKPKNRPRPQKFKRGDEPPRVPRERPEVDHSRYTLNWEKLQAKLTDYGNRRGHGLIHALERDRKTILRQNTFVEVVDSQHVKLHYRFDENGNPDPREDPQLIKCQRVILATGTRPKYLDIPGGREEDGLVMTTDEFYTSSQLPSGKILVIGGSYIAIETATFLAKYGQGCEVTILARSEILKEIDKEFQHKIINYLASLNIKTIVGVNPTRFTKICESDDGKPLIEARAKSSHEAVVKAGGGGGDIGDESVGEFNVIFLACGRQGHTEGMGFDKLPLRCRILTNPLNGKIKVRSNDMTKWMDTVYAIGDIADDKPGFLPMIKDAAHMMANRMLDKYRGNFNYNVQIPKVVYMPWEYAHVGMTEEAAREKYGNGVEVYSRKTLAFFDYYTMMRTNPKKEYCYGKLITRKYGCCYEILIGAHYWGPNAGEIIDGLFLSVNTNVYKTSMDSMLSVCDSYSEIFGLTSPVSDAGRRSWRGFWCHKCPAGAGEWTKFERKPEEDVEEEWLN